MVTRKGVVASGALAGNSPFLLHVAVQSVLNIDVEVEEPEVAENLVVV